MADARARLSSGLEATGGGRMSGLTGQARQPFGRLAKRPENCSGIVDVVCCTFLILDGYKVQTFRDANANNFKIFC